MRSQSDYVHRRGASESSDAECHANGTCGTLPCTSLEREFLRIGLDTFFCADTVDEETSFNMSSREMKRKSESEELAHRLKSNPLGFWRPGFVAVGK
jgi:hypothetical protein